MKNGFSIKEEFCIDYTGWTWNRCTKPIWEKHGTWIHKKVMCLEYSTFSKYLRPFAKQYVVIAKKE